MGLIDGLWAPVCVMRAMVTPDRATKPRKIRLLILGSCVSRDAFRTSGEGEAEIAVADYYARTSLASLSTKPVTVDIDMTSIASSFQRRMVERDLSKELMVRTAFPGIDVVLIDFMSDWYDLLLLSDGSGATDSRELRAAKHGAITKQARRIAGLSTEYLDRWALGWQMLKTHLQRVGLLERTLINQTYWAEVDNEGRHFDNKRQIQAFNSYLEGRYRALDRDLPGHQSIRYAQDQFIGDTRHIWGRYPAHLTEAVYGTCRNGIVSFVQAIKG